MKADIDLIDIEESSAIDQHLDAVMKAALKRKRHSVIVARSRMRQKASFAAMRTEETALCNQLNEILVGYDRRHRSFQADEREQHRALTDRPQQAYVEQVAIQQAIIRKNEKLHDRIADLTKFRRLIEIEQRREKDSMCTNMPHVSGKKNQTIELASSDGKARWVYFDGDEDPIYYEPLSEQSCTVSMQLVYQRMLDLYQDFSHGRIAVHETQCLGWRVQRPLYVSTEQEKRLLRFQFTKTIRCIDDTMEDIVHRTWVAFHNPTLYAKIYSTVVVARVVQRVNESMSVLIQNAPSPDGATNIRYFNMLAKMTGRNARNERVVALVKTIVNPAQAPKTVDSLKHHVIQQPQDIEWMKHGFSFLLFTEAHFDAVTGERVLQLHYGTHFECVSEVHARYLMIEVLGLASRWERMVLPSYHLTF
uniref:Uncharacterized protein n=1 Tax=Globisporangium ultimum (strain ATCC 200006 / CBS 805.95 / DAOM BR144) TaxID=431595 RepID=K3XC43_GLOUD